MAKKQQNDQVTETQVQDSNVPPVITKDVISEETVETIMGRIIRLAPDRAVWRSENKTIDMSQFTGVVTARVTDKLTAFEREQVVAGIRSGSILFTEKEETVEGAITSFDDSAEGMKARLFLDNPNTEVFMKELSGIRSKDFLVRAIKIYTLEYRNRPRLQLLEEQLKKIS